MLLMTVSIAWAREKTAPPAIYTEEILEYGVFVVAYGNGHICLYVEDILVAEGEDEAVYDVECSEFEKEYRLSATAQEEGKEVSEPVYYTVYVPAQKWLAVDAPEILTYMDPEMVYVDIAWPETIGNQVYTGQYEYIRPACDQADESYIVEAYTEANYPYAESAHAIATIEVPAQDPGWRAVAAPSVEYIIDLDKVIVRIDWPTTTGNHVYTGEYEYARPAYGQPDESYYAEAYTEADYPYEESAHAYLHINVPAMDGPYNPSDPHMEGYWVVTIDKNGEEIWNELMRRITDDWGTSISLDYAIYGGYIPDVDPVRQVPFYFVIDGVRWGASSNEQEAVLSNCWSNQLYEGGGFYTMPVGYIYTIGIIWGSGVKYGYAFMGGPTEGNPEDYVTNNLTDNTSFTVDKSSILLGNYLTFRTQIDFTEEYADKVSDVKLIVNLPSSCPLFKNSVLVGNKMIDYTIESNQVIIPLEDYSKVIRFCATPSVAGNFIANARVQYKLNGETVTESVGTVRFNVFELSINVSPMANNATIIVTGKAAMGQTVKVYDGDVQIGQTECLAYGTWRVVCDLNQPVNPSVHQIYALVETTNGQEYYTETKEVLYNESVPVLDKIMMYSHYGTETNVFDFVNAMVSRSYYNYFTGYPDFTFVVKLTGTMTSVSVHNLKINVLDTRQEVSTYDGVYDSAKNEWVCSAKYPNTDKLPVTVGAEWDYVLGDRTIHYEVKIINYMNGVTPNVYPEIIYLIDPSGFVYEAVPSNRLEGVTATAYYKDSETGEAVLWDAEQYEQRNPLLTDERGYYRWDVPVGMWQVKYEKDGYETTYSDWLPVPPPQLDVNIGMVQMRQPEVIKARAYPQAVELEFDKFMLPETLTEDNITVSVDGTAVSGSIELLNAEVDDPNAITTIRRAPGTGLTFASKVRFNADQTFNADKVTLHVKNVVESYAGVQMNDDYEVVLPLEYEMTQIVADSLLNVIYGDSHEMIVTVEPAFASMGKTLNVRCFSSMILSTDAETYTLDNNGQAVITVHGDLPGMSSLLFGIDGYDLSAATLVKVVMESEMTVATPTASISSGSEVQKGTEIYLSCATEGATIYYTLDGSCPCDNTDARMVYDGTPIIIDRDVTIKAMAVAEGMFDSEVATFYYRVSASFLKGDVNGDGAVNIADINKLIDYILRDLINSETLQRGDVNGDGTINISDINAVIQIILGPGTSHRAVEKVNTIDLLHLNNLTLQHGETGTLSVTVDNAVRYSALQCDIVLPDGLTLVNATATGGSVVETSIVDENTSRALTYSMTLLPFIGDSQPVLTLTVQADAALSDMSIIALKDIVLADMAGVAWYTGDCTAMINNASSIFDLTAGADKQIANVRYYNVAGQEMARPEGVTIQVTTYTDGTHSTTRLMK